MTDIPSPQPDDGGPAFPHEYKFGDGTAHRSDGMSLRDYFAAKALLAGWSANKSPAYDDETRAKYAYEMADAMLKARTA